MTVSYAVAVPGDEPDLVALLAAVDLQTEFLYVEPAERRAELAHLVERFATSARSERATFTVLARDGGSLVGFATVHVGTLNRIRHAGELAIAVDVSAQGRGVGRGLLETAVDESERRGVTRLELTVREDNLRAQKLYFAAGFEVEGLKRRAVVTNGTAYDELLMALLLPR